jgi:hypothetical protein
MSLSWYWVHLKSWKRLFLLGTSSFWDINISTTFNSLHPFGACQSQLNCGTNPTNCSKICFYIPSITKILNSPLPTGWPCSVPRILHKQSTSENCKLILTKTRLTVKQAHKEWTQSTWIKLSRLLEIESLRYTGRTSTSLWECADP